MSNPDRQSHYPGEGGRSQAGKSRVFRGALAWEQLFTLQPPSPNRSERSTSPLLVNISLCGAGWGGCSLGNDSSARDATGCLQSQAGARSPRGLPAVSHRPLLKRSRGVSTPSLRGSEQGGGSHRGRARSDPRWLLLPGSSARPQARVHPRCCKGRAGHRLRHLMAWSRARARPGWAGKSL